MQQQLRILIISVITVLFMPMILFAQQPDSLGIKKYKNEVRINLLAFILYKGINVSFEREIHLNHHLSLDFVGQDNFRIIVRPFTPNSKMIGTSVSYLYYLNKKNRNSSFYIGASAKVRFNHPLNVYTLGEKDIQEQIFQGITSYGLGVLGGYKIERNRIVFRTQLNVYKNIGKSFDNLVVDNYLHFKPIEIKPSISFGYRF